MVARGHGRERQRAEASATSTARRRRCTSRLDERTSAGQPAEPKLISGAWRRRNAWWSGGPGATGRPIVASPEVAEVHSGRLLSGSWSSVARRPPGRGGDAPRGPHEWEQPPCAAEGMGHHGQPRAARISRAELAISEKNPSGSDRAGYDGHSALDVAHGQNSM